MKNMFFRFAYLLAVWLKSQNLAKSSSTSYDKSGKVKNISDFSKY